MKKTLVTALVIVMTIGLVACGDSSYESNTDNYSSDNYDSNSSSSYSSYDSSNYSSDYDYGDYDSDYDYDKGYGYTAPEEGESFSDYVKRQDPELYESMKDIYNSLD